MVSAPSLGMELSSVFQQFTVTYLPSHFYRHIYRSLLSIVACFFAAIYRLQTH